MIVDSLTARTVIDDRHLVYEAIFCQHRIRVTFAGTEPEVLGSVVYLDTGFPGLRVSSPLHVEWAALHHEAIINEAKHIWANALRECNG